MSALLGLQNLSGAAIDVIKGIVRVLGCDSSMCVLPPCGTTMASNVRQVVRVFENGPQCCHCGGHRSAVTEGLGPVRDPSHSGFAVTQRPGRSAPIQTAAGWLAAT
jgi:hypothetical protein